MVCEGEKAARAVEDAGYRAASWLGGTGGVGQADFSRLRDSDVVLWSDADEPGRKAMARVAEKVNPYASTLRLVNVSDLPAQADAADVDVATRRAMIEASEAWSPSPEAVYPWYADGDFLEPFDTSPDADCMRTLRLHGGNLLAVKHHDGADMTLRVVTRGGRWDNDPDAIAKLVSDTSLEWAVTALQEDNIKANEAGDIARHAKKMRGAGGRQDALRSVGRVIERWREDGTIPNGLKVVYEDNLHLDGRFLGAPNGVIDLDTGELLTGPQAREKLVTRSIPDPYIPDAEHPDVERLLSHLPGDSRDYLLGALGFALRGHPSRRFYVLLGAPRGGKSTLLEAVRAALGDVKGIGDRVRSRNRRGRPA